MLTIIPIPAFNDNYIWLLHNGQNAVVVDPGNAAPVITTLLQLKLKLSAILITHHHSDHIDGVEPLLAHLALTNRSTQVYHQAMKSLIFSILR